MRKLLTAIGAGLLLVSTLTGCQGKKPQPGEIDGYDQGEQYLSIWVHSIEDTEEGRCYRRSVEAFNKKYNGTYYADIEFIPRNDSGGGYSDKINASVMSGDLPDVLTVDGPNIAAYASNGIIQPLKELTEEEKSIYLESILEQGTYQGKLYALGAMESSVGLYYNKEILKEAGIEVPKAEQPWTHSEFLEVLEKVKPVVEKRNGYALDLTFPAGESTIYYYAPFFWANGGNLVDESGMQVDHILNSPENVDTIRYFKTILEQGYMSKVPVEHLFESGRAAFKFDGAWEVNTIYNSYPDIELGVAPYIVGDSWDGERYTPTGSWAYAASAKTENLEGATELVKWMSGVESGTMLWEEAKCFPSTYQAFESIDIFKTDENYRALYEQLSSYGHPRPKTPVYPQVSISFQQVLENCVLTGREPQAELEKAIERINAKLKRYRVNE
ncbi:MAG: sugar ABC transporter substrate-binding protein [Lachnospiraceae bacterium]|nr:sugar ABC transporter substrate-binding protein [Lachnospiraceae bacterium]